MVVLMWPGDLMLRSRIWVFNFKGTQLIKIVTRYKTENICETKGKYSLEYSGPKIALKVKSEPQFLMNNCSLIKDLANQ